MYNCIALKQSLIDLILRDLDVVQSLVSFLNFDLFGKFVQIVEIAFLFS